MIVRFSFESKKNMQYIKINLKICIKKNIALALIEFFQGGGRKLFAPHARITKMIISEGGGAQICYRANLPNTDFLPCPWKNPVAAPAPPLM